MNKKWMMSCVVAVLGVAALAEEVPEVTPKVDTAAELAKKLSNPIASLISLPIQANYDHGYGADGKGSVWRVNIQPVIPISLSEDWNLISRTIVPLVEQDLSGKNFDESGLGDVVQSLFLSPVEPTDNGWVWGAGPVFLLPTATDSHLGAEQWGIGPTAVALKQVGAWTVGGLCNHIWSVAGERGRVDMNANRADVNATFIQPFLSYLTPTKTTLALNMESTYDWDAAQWSVPINLTAMQMLKIGSQMMQFGGGVRYWADSPENGPDGWGARIQLTFIFPK